MSSDERQEAIWDIILQRKFETVPNIADELGVCTRTIYGDVTKMRKKYPIEPISGKYGGVYLVHKPHNAAMHLTPLQETTLQELIFSQPMEIQQVLQSILDVFSDWPALNGGVATAAKIDCYFHFASRFPS